MNALSGAGPQYVGPSSDTSQAWDMGRQAAGTMGTLANTGTQNYNFLSSAADVANNPYVQGMMRTNNQQAMQSLTRQMLPALQNAGIGGGGLGSSRLGLAQGQAIGDTQTALQNANNALMLGAYQQGLGAQQSALSGLGALQQAQLAPGLAYGTVGQSREGYQQAAQDAPWRHIQNLGAAQQYLNPLGSLQGTTNATGTSASGPQGAYGPGANAPAQQAAAAPDWYNAPPPWYQPEQQQPQQYQPFNQYGGSGYSGG
jgi:hypothetical protein